MNIRVLPALLCASSVLLGGCQPSRESVTAGQIGCPVSEVSTSSMGSSVGWSQSAESWAAECRGRRFICTQLTTSSRDLGWLSGNGTDAVDSDVSCREELSAQPAPSSPAPARTRALASSAPPEGAAGFAFGLTRADARTRCEKAGHAWQEDASAHALCSGAASPLSFPASVKLTFCGGRACGVTLTYTPASDWASSFSELDSGLTAKYGAATTRQMRVPAMCRTAQQFDSCVLDGTLSLKASWQWPGGERLKLFAGRPSPHTGAATLQLTYVRKSSPTRVDTSAL